MFKVKYDNQVSRSPKSLVPVGMVILYFLIVDDRGVHSWLSNPFLLKYEAIDEGHTSSSKKHFNQNIYFIFSTNYKKKMVVRWHLPQTVVILNS